MGEHVAEMDSLLRGAFPGQDEEFYEYGKWGGGAFNAEAAKTLADVRKAMQINYFEDADLIAEHTKKYQK